ncbi:MAG: hypothetical protein ACXVCY_09365 [Pseudobdellovibrionaceae bacterium]
MNSQDFLILNVVGAGAFVFWYVVSRGHSRRPTQLNLKAKDTVPPVISPLPEPQVVTCINHPDLVVVKPKSLNVMFNYNGHSWDAYEVLGLPAGSSIKAVTEAYQAALRSDNKSSIDFLETAYKAILNKAG